MLEYKLRDLAKGKLRREDKCAAIRLTLDCDDMYVTVSDIYRMAGR